MNNHIGFQKGYTPWNKGISTTNNGSFKKGQEPWNTGIKCPWTTKLNKTRAGKPCFNRSTKVLVQCDFCDKEFMRRWPSIKDKVFCSTKCFSSFPKTKETLKAQSNALKKYFSKPGSKEKMLKSILTCRFPTSFEKRLIDLIKENSLDYKYVGDGQVFIARRNPDFINTNGKKVIIETFYSYYKDKDYVNQRRKLFAKYGFKTVFLDERHVLSKNWKEVCLNKIRRCEN